jgi:hypothetical protein
MKWIVFVLTYYQIAFVTADTGPLFQAPLNCSKYLWLFLLFCIVFPFFLAYYIHAMDNIGDVSGDCKYLLFLAICVLICQLFNLRMRHMVTV